MIPEKVIVLTQNSHIVDRISQCGILEPIRHIRTTHELPAYSENPFLLLVDIAMSVYAKDLHFEGSKKILIVPSERELGIDLFSSFDDYISLSATNQILALRLNTYVGTIFQSRNLVNNQNKYKQLVEQSGDTVILLDKYGIMCEVNSHVCMVSGFSDTELLQHHIRKIFPDTNFIEKLHPAIPSGSLVETMLHTKFDTLKPKEIRISKIILEQELYFLVIARDISERLKTLKKIEDSEERFRTVIKHSPNGMIIFKDDTISFINLVGLKILGGTYEDFIDQSFFRLVSPAYRADLLQFIKKSTKRDEPISKDVTFIDLQNKEVSVNLNCVPIDIQGEIHYFIIFQDLTELKRTQYDLETKDLRLREIQKIAKLGHYEINIIKNNVYWSDEVYKIYGVSQRTFSPTYAKTLEFVHPDDRETVRKAYENSLITREPYEIVHRIILPNGTIKYLNETCSTMYDEHGVPVRSLGTVMDITHTIRTEKALQQTEEKFRLLFENLDEPFLICKPSYDETGKVFDFIITELNPACKKLFRGNYLDVKEHSIREIFYEPDIWIEKYTYAFEHSETISFRKYSTDLHKYLDIVLFPVMGKKQIAGIYSDVTEKVYSENQLKQLTARLQKIQEYAKIGFYDVHIVTHKSMWSDVMIQIFEYSKKDKPSFDLYLQRIHPDDRENVRQAYSDSIKKHKTYVTLEYRLLFPDGRIKHIYTEFYNTFEGKTCLHTEGWLQDITDLTIATSALRESEEKLRMVTSGTQLGLWEWDIFNKEFLIDETGSQMLGYKPQELWGDDTIYLDLIHKEDKEVVEKKLIKFWQRTNQLFNAEFRVLMKNGRYKWVSCVGVSSEYRMGKVSKMIGFNQDISLRKKAEEDLRDSENKFRRIFEIENDSLFLADSKTGKILETNQAAVKLYGYSRKELLSRNFQDLSVNPVNIMTLIHRQKTRVDSEIAVSKHGVHCPIEISFAYFTWKGKDVFLAAVRDVSERRRVEQELRSAKEKAEESDRLKSAFLANMSHEIRTPLNAIVGFSRLLARKNYDQEKRKIFIDDIQSNSNQLLTIINDILDISKIESGQFILNPTQVCINKLLQEVYDTMQLQIKDKDLVLFCEKPLPDSDVTITIDEVRLKQILTNLLNNAIKFTEQGYIHFGYKAQKSKQLLFFVRDTGIGIAPEKHAIIFEHFRQEDDTTTRKYGGTGLGLSISKKLIELMGGTIWVESEKNKGAQFFVTVPLIQSQTLDHVTNVTHIETVAHASFNGETILVVDDHTSSYIFISEMFENQNVRVIQATSGEQAIELCKQFPTIQLVLMDIQMSGVSGVDAMKQIKQLFPAIPIVAQTAFAQKGDRERFMQQGFDDYITKPLDERDLQEIFKRFLSSN
ncbi:MAG TPA: PAS domain S-box protein [Bacteroidales bacterium]|nr:PAS domain S-box protein [Bacteroidales bacterium]